MSNLTGLWLFFSMPVMMLAVKMVKMRRRREAAAGIIKACKGRRGSGRLQAVLAAAAVSDYRCAIVLCHGEILGTVWTLTGLWLTYNMPVMTLMVKMMRRREAVTGIIKACKGRKGSGRLQAVLAAAVVSGVLWYAETLWTLIILTLFLKCAGEDAVGEYKEGQQGDRGGSDRHDGSWLLLQRQVTCCGFQM
jgi:hypothetical protein